MKFLNNKVCLIINSVGSNTGELTQNQQSQHFKILILPSTLHVSVKKDKVLNIVKKMQQKNK